jgi:hypothetical protein
MTETSCPDCHPQAAPLAITSTTTHIHMVYRCGHIRTRTLT